MGISRRKPRLAALLSAVLACGLYPGAASTAQAASFPDTAGHWAETAIEWGVSAGIVNGFPDGAFRPDGLVTEAQFAAMLFRAFPAAAPQETGPYWYSAYYEQAKAWQWPLDAADADEPALRGHVARIIAASQGSQLSVLEAAAWLLERKLASGRQTEDGRVEFAEFEPLTRAEAVQFIRNVSEAGLSIGAADKPPESVRKDAAVTVSGIAVGDSESALLEALGQPARKETSEYGFTWYVYNGDYKQFSMFGISGGEVVALYANGGNLQVNELPGEPLDYIEKDFTRYMIPDQDEYNVYDAGSVFITVFYDTHEQYSVSGVQAVAKPTEIALKGFYGKPSGELADSFARITLDLVNSARVKRGLQALEWDDGAAQTAQEHSEDMAKNEYFNHVNPRGENHGDRLENNGVDFIVAGENIAYGQTSAIFAHESWMNSSGHRKNVLGDYDRLGVGVSFSKDSVPYYTQNFLRTKQ